ncbi:MAG: glycoside hydrolase family 127 protein [Bryobacteraceae bacterium]|nr:glycoside hydrolase family 127 protein [Bryobacteraceae bacterium]
MIPRRTTVAAIGLALCALQAAGQDRFVPAPYKGQSIGGVLGDRMKINLEGRLLRVDEQGITEGFHQRPGKHAWIGEHAGKFLHAAANTWEFSADPRLKILMDRVARSVIAGQLPDGYLGTYTDDKRWTSWDVWAHKYNLIGLLSYYEATGYEPALTASRRMGDLLIRTFGDGDGTQKRDLIASSTHVGMAATSVLEPICTLYRLTRDQRYLAFAQSIVKSWDQPDGPKIVASLLAGNSVFRTANAKAYEMMSCLVGLVELYRATGDPKYLNVAKAAWEDIASKRLYITGATSAHEHFRDDFDLPATNSADVGEGCATVTWLQLSWQLLRVTGEPKYASELEKTVFNQLLAAQNPANGEICYFTPMIGRKNPTPGINCCVSSEPRGISMIPQLTWGSLRGGVAVLLYAPGKATVDGIGIESATDFPSTGKIALTLGPAAEKRFPLFLRVPTWTAHFTAKAGGKTYKGEPGEYLEIDRTWKPGDRVEIDMDIITRVLDGGPSYPGHVAVQRGPQVLALELTKNLALPSIHAAGLRSLSPRLGQPPYVVDGVAVVDGRKTAQKLTLVPFMDAVTYRIWLPKEATLPARDAAVSLFGTESSSRLAEKEGSICDGRPETYRSTNRGKPAAEDWFAVRFDRPETIRRVVFRHGDMSAEGGWFADKPRIEIQRAGSQKWESVGTLANYPAERSQFSDRQAFTLQLPAPVEATAIRAAGRPAGYVTCAELEAWR